MRAVSALEAQGMDEATVQAVRVFAQMSTCCSPEAVQQQAPPLIKQWSNHRDFSVREALACCMSLLAKRMPLQGWEETLMPYFYQLSRDSNWRVRRACAADVPRLAEELQHRQAAAEAEAAAGTAGASAQLLQNGSSHLPPRHGHWHHGDNHQQQQQQDQQQQAHAAANGSSTGNYKSSSFQLADAAGFVVGSMGSIPVLGGCSSLCAARPMPGHSPAVPSPRTPAQAVTGKAAIMGSHPMRNSLIVDESILASEVAEDGGGSQPGSPSGTNGSSSSSQLRDGPQQQQQQQEVPGDGMGLVNHGMNGHQSGGYSRGGVRGLGGGSSSSSATCSPVSSADEAEDGGAYAAASTSSSESFGPRSGYRCKLRQHQPQLHTSWVSLRECMDALTVDSSHWVKVSALSGLGSFLVNLPACQMSQLLINRYLAMAKSSVVVYEISVALACAQSFGALAEKLGAERWPQIRWVNRGLCTMVGTMAAFLIAIGGLRWVRVIKCGMDGLRVKQGDLLLLATRVRPGMYVTERSSMPKAA